MIINNKLTSRIRILWLVTIYFIYRSLTGYLNNNSEEMVIWGMITVVYIISLIILMFAVKRMQNEKILNE
ncbi:MAG: hypothetical protein ACTSR8_00175 [Promethearchaeota archaeon]